MRNSTRLPRWFRLCSKLARDSQGLYKLGCVLVRGGCVFAQGVNAYRKTKSIGVDYDMSRSIHAEINALCRGLHRHRDIDHCTLYVVRLRKDGSFGDAKPCKGCQKAIVANGVRSVFYSTVVYPYFEEWRL